jgi:hypothetical protein
MDDSTDAKRCGLWIGEASRTGDVAGRRRRNRRNIANRRDTDGRAVLVRSRIAALGE